MTTRHLSARLPALAFVALAVSTLVRCGDDDDDGGGGSSGTSDEASDTGDDGEDGSGDGDGDDGGADCAQACEQLSECGVPTPDCLMLCGAGGDACASCLAGSSMCGEDCLAACEGGNESGETGETSDTSDTSDTGDEGPDPDCTTENECGLGQECVACNLSATEGWCEFSDACDFDEDCGSGRVCGYNVETSEYRCISADYCP
jgi:hypothetical protein